jgi:hypothetical protein
VSVGAPTIRLKDPQLTPNAPERSAESVRFFGGNGHPFSWPLESVDQPEGSSDETQQWDCYNGTPERWRFEYVGNVSGEYYYRVRNVNSGKCLEVRDGYTDNGGIIEQYDCWDGPMQLWTPRTAPATDHVWLVNRNSGKCLDDTDWSPWAGTSLQQVDCGPYTAQYWRLYPV